MVEKMKKTENDNNQAMRKNIRRRLAQMFFGFIAMYALLCLSAGTLTWKWGLVYFALNVLVVVMNSLVIPPEVIAERGAKKEGVKKWDKILTYVGMIPYLGILIIPGLDYRFGWSGDLSITIRIAGIILFILGNALFTWAMISNRFFSTRVRIQLDRDHKVETGGPYRFVRHPGYVGYLIFSFGAPLIMGSFWGLIPAGLFIIFFIIRTALEDATLIKELDGYRKYADKIRYRLIPGIW